MNYGIKLSTEPIQYPTKCTGLSRDNPHESGGNRCNVINTAKNNTVLVTMYQILRSHVIAASNVSIEYVPVPPGVLRSLTKEA